MEPDPERQALDFDKDVRAAQLRKLSAQQEQIAQTGGQLRRQNEKNLAKVDTSYKETTELESQLIVHKMENMNLITDSEMEGIKFLRHSGERNRDSQSLNGQINQIQLIIAMLQKEFSLAQVEEENMKEVEKEEQELVKEKARMKEAGSQMVSADVIEQTASY